MNPVSKQQTTETMTHSQAKALAEAYKEKHGCTWREACGAIKKTHPEARQAFGMPSELDKLN
jgi:hypothetical protein